MLNGQQSRLVIRMEKIARLRVANIPDARIAALVNMTPQGLAIIVARPEYQKIEQEVLARATSLMDEALADNVSAIRDHFAVGVPMAMRAILDTIRQDKDLKSRLEAAREVLDRDPQRAFAKDNVTLKDGAGRIIDVPASVFSGAVATGAMVAAGVKAIPRTTAEAMVPKALEREEEEVDVNA
jgi:hypothetical protein